MVSIDVKAKLQLTADKTNEELRAQIINLKDELRLERYAHERTKQSVGELRALIKSINDKMEVIVDQFKSKSSKRIQEKISKAKRKIKVMLWLNKQTSNKTTVPII